VNLFFTQAEIRALQHIFNLPEQWRRCEVGDFTGRAVTQHIPWFSPEQYARDKYILVAERSSSAFGPVPASSQDLFLDILQAQLFFFRHPVTKHEQLFPLPLALNVEPCGFTQKFGTAAVLLFGDLVDFLQQRILKGDVDGDGAHGWLFWHCPFA